MFLKRKVKEEKSFTVLLFFSFYFIVKIPHIDLFSFVFWKKSKTPKPLSKLTDL